MGRELGKERMQIHRWLKRLGLEPVIDRESAKILDSTDDIDREALPSAVDLVVVLGHHPRRFVALFEDESGAVFASRGTGWQLLQDMPFVPSSGSLNRALPRAIDLPSSSAGSRSRCHAPNAAYDTGRSGRSRP